MNSEDNFDQSSTIDFNYTNDDSDTDSASLPDLDMNINKHTNSPQIEIESNIDENNPNVEEHDYHNKSKKQRKRKGPFSMEKNQSDYQQLKNAKIRQVDLLTEQCIECKEFFYSVTESDKHVRRVSCKTNPGKKKGPVKNAKCDIFFRSGKDTF